MGKLYDWVKEKISGIRVDGASNLDDGVPDDAIRDKQLRSLIRQKTFIESQMMKEDIKRKLQMYHSMRDKEMLGGGTMVRTNTKVKPVKVNYLKTDTFKKTNL